MSSTPNQDALDAPLPLLTASSSASPYPINCLPPLLRNAATAIAKHVQASTAIAGQCLLGAATHLLQARVNAPSINNPAGMPCSLFLLSLGSSGDRKSACRDLAFTPIDRHEHAAYTRYLATTKSARQKTPSNSLSKGENVPSALQDPRTQLTDATFEGVVGEFIRGKSACTWDTDEGSQLLSGASLKSDHASSIIGGLCRAFDKGSFDRLRSKNNSETSGTAYNRRLSIHLLAQPEALLAALSQPLLITQGFLPRFLFTAPESLAGKRLLTEQMLERPPHVIAALQAFWGRCEELLETPTFAHPDTAEINPPVLALTRPAQDVWLDFYNDVEAQMGNAGQYALIRPFAARAGEQARRVASVLAGFAGANRIDETAMEQACRLVEHSVTEWHRHSTARTADPQLVAAKDLLDWLKAKGWNDFHRDKLGKSGPSYARKAKARDGLLEVLIEHRQLLSVDNKVFHLNPLAEVEDVAET